MDDKVKMSDTARKMIENQNIIIAQLMARLEVLEKREP